MSHIEIPNINLIWANFDPEKGQKNIYSHKVFVIMSFSIPYRNSKACLSLKFAYTKITISVKIKKYDVIQGKQHINLMAVERSTQYFFYWKKGKRKTKNSYHKIQTTDLPQPLKESVKVVWIIWDFLNLEFKNVIINRKR